eukprot:1604274-Amphidinium_carterae.1
MEHQNDSKDLGHPSPQVDRKIERLQSFRSQANAVEKCPSAKHTAAFQQAPLGAIWLSVLNSHKQL